MKRLSLVALMVLVALVGMVGLSHAQTLSAISTASGRNVFPPYPNKEEDEIARTEANAVSALQATANATNGAVTQPPATVNAETEYNWTAYYDPNSGPVTELPATVNTGVPAKAKMYYITAGFFTGAEAITACDSGFHIATLSEIQDPSRLLYAPRLRPAYDSDYDEAPFEQTLEQFPDHTGWVRSEADSLMGLVYDWDGWRSSSDQQSGKTMTRRSLRGEKGRSLYESDPAAWWQLTRKVSCSIPEHVWCVEDPDEHSATRTSKSTQ